MGTGKNDLSAALDRPVPRAALPRTRTIAIGLALACGLLAYRGLLPYDPYPVEFTGNSELEDWFFRPSGSSPILIFGVALCMLYTRHRALRRAALAGGRGASGLVFLLPGALLHPWALYTGAPDLLLVSFVLCCLGAAAWLGGGRGLRAALLPALFLLLLVPLPAVLVNQIMYPLQLATAQAAAAVLDAIGIPAVATGTYIVTHERVFQVIESCAGLRTVSTLVMSALIYSDLFYRSQLQSLLLVLLAPAIGLFVNLARVLSLTLNPESQFAAVHTTQGVVMLVVGVLLLAAVAKGLALLLPAAPGDLPRWTPPDESGVESPAVDGSFLLRPVLLGALFAGLLAGSVLLEPWKPARMIWWSPAKLPEHLMGLDARYLELDKKLMGSVFASGWTRRSYAPADSPTGAGESKERPAEALAPGAIELFVASDDLGVRHTSLISPKTVLPEPGYDVRDERNVTLGDADFPAQALILERLGRRVLVYRWYLGTFDLATETLRGVLALDRSFLRRERRPMVVRISTGIDDASGGRVQAEARLRAFARALEPEILRIATPEPL